MKAQKAGIGIVLAFLSSIVLVHPAEALTLHTVVSPDGSTRMTVRNENDGTLTYNIQQNGKTVIQHGTLGVKQKHMTCLNICISTVKHREKSNRTTH